MPREKGGFWVAFAAAAFYPLTRAVARRRFTGLEHIPSRGPALVVANHISHLDPYYTAVFVHKAGRVPRFLAKDSLWGKPVIRRVMAGSGQIPVHRRSANARQSLSAAVEALGSGKVVVIYPDGTVTRDPGMWPMSPRTGMARLALAADVPVIPLVHWGTHRVWGSYGKGFHPVPRKRVEVHAGPPIDLSRFRGRAVDGPLLHEASEYLVAQIVALLEQVRGERAPESRFVWRPPDTAHSPEGRSAT